MIASCAFFLFYLSLKLLKRNYKKKYAYIYRENLENKKLK